MPSLQTTVHRIWMITAFHMLCCPPLLSTTSLSNGLATRSTIRYFVALLNSPGYCHLRCCCCRGQIEAENFFVWIIKIIPQYMSSLFRPSVISIMYQPVSSRGQFLSSLVALMTRIFHSPSLSLIALLLELYCRPICFWGWSTLFPFFHSAFSAV